MCVGFALLKGNYVSVCVYFGEPTFTLLMYFCLHTSSRMFKVSIFQLRHSLFLLGLF